MAVRPRKPPVSPRPVERVAVPCCTCGRPTSMKVEKALLEEIEVLHLCNACLEADDPPAAPVKAAD